MPAAPTAMYFSSAHEQRIIYSGVNTTLNWLKEAGPARTAIKLSFRGK